MFELHRESGIKAMLIAGLAHIIIITTNKVFEMIRNKQGIGILIMNMVVRFYRRFYYSRFMLAPVMGGIKASHYITTKRRI